MTASHVTRQACVAVAALWAWSALIPAAGAAPAGKQPLAYWVKHPCGLVALSRIEAVLKAPLDPGTPLVGTSGAGCTSRTTSATAAAKNRNFDLEIVDGPMPSASSIAVGKVVKEPSIGRNDYCVDIPGASATAYSVPAHGGKPAYLYVATDTCPDATQLVKDALARVG